MESGGAALLRIYFIRTLPTITLDVGKYNCVVARARIATAAQLCLLVRSMTFRDPRVRLHDVGSRLTARCAAGICRYELYCAISKDYMCCVRGTSELHNVARGVGTVVQDVMTYVSSHGRRGRGAIATIDPDGNCWQMSGG